MEIKRQIYREIKNHLSKLEITLIVGPRQVGKTTLITEINEELIKKGGTEINFISFPEILRHDILELRG